MIFLSYFILICFIFLIVNYYSSKNFFLTNQTGESHQSLATKNAVPLTGGLFILLAIFYELHEFKKIIIGSILLFSLGVLSDLKIIKSSSFRFLFQILIIIFIGLLEI